MTLLRKKRHFKGDERRSRGSRSGSEYPRKSSAFFIRPYLVTGQIYKSRLNDITLTLLESVPELFRGNVWILPVRNREVGRGKLSLSRTAYNCRVGLSIILGERTLFEEVSLRWLGSNQLPRKCNYGGSLKDGIERREQYASALPFSYLGGLFAGTSNSTKFLVGTQNDAMLLFTFEESEMAYVITDLGSGITEAGLVPLDFNREYLFHVRFHSDGYRELHQRRIKFIAKSWDEITFE